MKRQRKVDNDTAANKKIQKKGEKNHNFNRLIPIYYFNLIFNYLKWREERTCYNKLDSVR